MVLAIKLKDGGTIRVEKVSKILIFSSGKVTEEITDFSTFHYNYHDTYSFQGENIVVVKGSEISFLQFV